MRKLIVIVAIASGFFIASCGNQNGSTNESGTDTKNTTKGVNDTNQVGNQTGDLPPAEDSFVNAIPKGNMAASDNVKRGAALIAARDCKTCHTINQKNIGPSYQMIADKYGNNDAMADELSLKIIKGGSGRWGQVVMPPHNDVSTEDARDMARYILSLSANK
jgi:cytochrome c